MYIIHRTNNGKVLLALILLYSTYIYITPTPVEITLHDNQLIAKTRFLLFFFFRKSHIYLKYSQANLDYCLICLQQHNA